MWFRAGSQADLQLWIDDAGAVAGLDFSYQAAARLTLLRWRAGQPVWHGLVDDGEQRPGHYKASILLNQPTTPDWQWLAGWLNESRGLPADIHRAVLEIVSQRPADPVPLH